MQPKYCNILVYMVAHMFSPSYNSLLDCHIIITYIFYIIFTLIVFDINKWLLQLNHVYCCNNTSVKDVDLDLCMLVACFILSSKPVYCYNSVYVIL